MDNIPVRSTEEQVSQGEVTPWETQRVLLLSHTEPAENTSCPLPYAVGNCE